MMSAVCAYACGIPAMDPPFDGEEPTHDTGSAKRWRPCMPAVAAGLTDHVWTLWEVLRARTLING